MVYTMTTDKDPNGWVEAGTEVVYYFHLFAHAKTPLDQADALLHLSNHVFDLKTWLPDYDGNTGTVAWERDDNG